MRGLVRQFVSVTGWLCLGFAAASGIGLFVLFPQRSSKYYDGPTAAYEISILFTIPFLIALSATLIFFARGARRARIGVTYWTVVMLALIPWIVAFAHYEARGGEDAFQNALRAWGLR